MLAPCPSAVFHSVFQLSMTSTEDPCRCQPGCGIGLCGTVIKPLAWHAIPPAALSSAPACSIPSFQSCRVGVHQGAHPSSAFNQSITLFQPIAGCVQELMDLVSPGIPILGLPEPARSQT